MAARITRHMGEIIALDDQPFSKRCEVQVHDMIGPPKINHTFLHHVYQACDTLPLSGMNGYGKVSWVRSQGYAILFTSDI